MRSNRKTCDISFLFLVCCSFLLFRESSGRDYFGYSVLKAIPRTEQQMYYLQSLEELVQSPPFDIDVWKPSSGLNDSTIVMMNPKASRSILQEMQQLDLEYSYSIPDVEQ